jgi:hypothetical protein
MCATCGCGLKDKSAAGYGKGKKSAKKTVAKPMSAMKKMGKKK